MLSAHGVEGYTQIAAPLSLQNQLIVIGGLFIELRPVQEAAAAKVEEFSHDDVFGALEALHGSAAVADANRWVADVLYPEHAESPTVAVLRLKAGLSQRGLADEMGVKQPYIARLESGSENPTYSTMEKWANALSVPVGTLASALKTTIEAARNAA